MEKALLDQYVAGLTEHINGLHGVVVTIEGKRYQHMPLIEIKPNGLRDYQDNETLSYNETKFELGYTINIYSEDIEDKIGDDVVMELGTEVSQYFRSEGFAIRFDDIIPNIDATVSRKMIRATGIYDTVRKVIYRN